MTVYRATRPSDYRPKHRRTGFLARNAGLAACLSIWLGGGIMGAALVTFS